MKKPWEIAEKIDQEDFDLDPTVASGRTPYDKGDGRNKDWIGETKSTEKKTFTINIDKFSQWALQAAQKRKQFFLSIHFLEGNKREELIVIRKSLFKILLNEFLQRDS